MTTQIFVLEVLPSRIRVWLSTLAVVTSGQPSQSADRLNHIYIFMQGLGVPLSSANHILHPNICKSNLYRDLGSFGALACKTKMDLVLLMQPNMTTNHSCLLHKLSICCGSCDDAD